MPTHAKCKSAFYDLALLGTESTKSNDDKFLLPESLHGSERIWTSKEDQSILSKVK